MKFALMVVFKVTESNTLEFKKALRFHSENTWREEGSIKFVSYVDESDPSTFYLYELYEDRAAFEAHTKTDYIVKFRDLVTPLLREPSVIYRGVPVFNDPTSPKGEI
jgi:(4S)-4-hydroxy-5-phosphonooxypentane-2,3-dione isomerase